MDVKEKTAKDFIEYLRTLADTSSIYICGAGHYGGLIGGILNKAHINWAGYLDNNTDICKEVYNNKEVMYLPTAVLSKHAIYIISTIYTDVRKSIFQQLQRHGINEKNILRFNGNELLNDLNDFLSQEFVDKDKLRRFKDYHKGERCFIIGRGPSLCARDLEATSNDYTFSCNKIFESYDTVKWRPTYYMVADPTEARKYFPIKEKLERVSRFSKENFICAWSMLTLLYDCGSLENVNFFFACDADQNGRARFSYEIPNQIYTMGTVTYSMLQLAAYMGFEKIYLLGIDHNFSVDIQEDGSVIRKDVQDHASLTGGDSFSHVKFGQLPRTYRSNEGYISARDYAQANGIKIYNATRGGKLEIFERVDFDSLF